MIIEAEIIKGSWAKSIREAVGQLYEYRYFKVADQDSALILSASKRVPDPWLQYLENGRGSGAMWPRARSFEMSRLARRTLG